MSITLRFESSLTRRPIIENKNTNSKYLLSVIYYPQLICYKTNQFMSLWDELIGNICSSYVVFQNIENPKCFVLNNKKIDRNTCMFFTKFNNNLSARQNEPAIAQLVERKTVDVFMTVIFRSLISIHLLYLSHIRG